MTCPIAAGLGNGARVAFGCAVGVGLAAGVALAAVAVAAVAAVAGVGRAAGRAVLVTATGRAAAEARRTEAAVGTVVGAEATDAEDAAGCAVPALGEVVAACADTGVAVAWAAGLAVAVAAGLAVADGWDEAPVPFCPASFEDDGGVLWQPVARRTAAPNTTVMTRRGLHMVPTPPTSHGGSRWHGATGRNSTTRKLPILEEMVFLDIRAEASPVPGAG